MKDHKSKVFHKDDVPNKLDGPIYALYLQLVAKGTVDLRVWEASRKLIGTDKLSLKDIVVRLDKNDVEDEIPVQRVITNDA